jgi:hypothetical protein
MESKHTNYTADSNNSTNKNKVFHKIIHDIRNMKPLTNEIINSINNMTHDEKMDIIISYSYIVETLVAALNN